MRRAGYKRNGRAPERLPLLKRAAGPGLDGHVAVWHALRRGCLYYLARAAVTPLPLDLRRVVLLLFGLAVVCVALAGLYTNHYLFVGPLGEGLPDISPTDFQLVLAFQLTAGLCVVWSFALVALATPGVASRLLGLWERLTASDAAVRAAGVAVLALAAVYTAARFAFNIETIHAPLQSFTDGTALLPFQYRALVPWLVRGLTEAVPALARTDVRVLYAPFEFAAALGVYAAFAYLLRVLGWTASGARLAALGVFVPLAFNLAAPWRYNNVFFPYDTPSVAFFTLGLALLLDGKLPAYYALFVLATLNRETTCFLTMAYVALSVGRERPVRIAAHVAAQTALWGAVKVGLLALYAANQPLDLQTGGLFSEMVGRNARILVSLPGIVYILFVTMGGLAGAAVLLWHRVRDARVRRLTWIALPFLAGMAVVGELMEVRIYSELIPLVAASLAFAVRSVVAEAAISARSVEHPRSALAACAP